MRPSTQIAQADPAQDVAEPKGRQPRQGQEDHQLLDRVRVYPVGQLELTIAGHGRRLEAQFRAPPLDLERGRDGEGDHRDRSERRVGNRVHRLSRLSVSRFGHARRPVGSRDRRQRSVSSSAGKRVSTLSSWASRSVGTATDAITEKKASLTSFIRILTTNAGVTA